MQIAMQFTHTPLYAMVTRHAAFLNHAPTRRILSA